MEFCLEAWGWSFGWKWAFRPGLRHEDQGLLDFFFGGGLEDPQVEYDPGIPTGNWYLVLEFSLTVVCWVTLNKTFPL